MSRSKLSFATKRAVLHRLGVPIVDGPHDVACAYCGDIHTITIQLQRDGRPARISQSVMALDHIHPVSRGGSNDASKLTLACYSCNASKGARLVGQWKPREAV